MAAGGWGAALSSMFTGDNMANFAKLTSGLGSVYSAYNSNKLGNKQIDLMGQQNDLLLSDYNTRLKDKEKQNTAFSSVWS